MADEMGENNLKHALDDNCTDPDCEIHNPEVGVAEGTVSKTELAYYVAGLYAGIGFAAEAAFHSMEDIHDELVNSGIAPKPLMPGELDPRD